jgi:hypothetical protein
MRSLDQQTKTSGDVDSSLPSRRKRYLSKEDEGPTHSYRLRRTIVLVILAALVAAVMTNVKGQLTRVDERRRKSSSDLESIHHKVDQQRTEFELGVNHDRELAQGVSMDVGHTDVLHQHFEGWIWLMPDRKTIWIHSCGIQQPLTFCSQGDDRPRELVITRVTKYSVIGYVLTPQERPAATSNTALFTPDGLAVADFQGAR